MQVRQVRDGHFAQQVNQNDAQSVGSWCCRGIRAAALGFRETSVEDADKLVDWLTPQVVPYDRALADLETVSHRADKGDAPIEVRGYRFSEDAISPHERFVTMSSALGPMFKGCELTSVPDNEWDFPTYAHSVFTADRDSRHGSPTMLAVEEVLEFLTARLK